MFRTQNYTEAGFLRTCGYQFHAERLPGDSLSTLCFEALDAEQAKVLLSGQDFHFFRRCAHAIRAVRDAARDANLSVQREGAR
jgi:hypothetical protein